MTNIQKQIIKYIEKLFEIDMQFGQIVSNIFLDGNPYHISDEFTLERLKKLEKTISKQKHNNENNST